MREVSALCLYLLVASLHILIIDLTSLRDTSAMDSEDKLIPRCLPSSTTQDIPCLTIACSTASLVVSGTLSICVKNQTNSFGLTREENKVSSVLAVRLAPAHRAQVAANTHLAPSITQIILPSIDQHLSNNRSSITLPQERRRWVSRSEYKFNHHRY